MFSIIILLSFLILPVSQLNIQYEIIHGISDQ